jgi:hypothetical protein
MLGVQFGVSTTAISTYITAWPSLSGGMFAAVGSVMDWTGRKLGFGDESDTGSDDGDQEFRVAPVLLVQGNFLLPVVFAFLGAAAYVVLDFYTKLRASTLAVQDRVLGPIRLVLGLVVGACIGLLYTASGTAAQGGAANLIGALSLSASGVAFLAGFGVEGVFDFLRELITRVFPSPAKQ